MLIVHLFVSYAHVNLCHFFFLLVSGVGCDFCLWLFLDFSVYLLVAFHFVLMCFSVLFSTAIISLWEESVGLYASCATVY